VITAEQWYDPDPEKKNYYQGDVLSKIPFFQLPTFSPAGRQDAWGILRPRINRNRPDTRSSNEVLRNLPNELIGRAAKDLTDAWESPDGEHIIAHSIKMNVMLISRSCDIDKPMRKHFLVSPVIAFQTLKEEQKTDEKLNRIRKAEILHWFYLPGKEGLPESYADLSQMVPLHRSFFEEKLLQTSLLTRLSALGTSCLQIALSDFYGTKFGFSPQDLCPQDGRYACSTCFYSGFPTAVSKDVSKGSTFDDCPNCKSESTWVKVLIRTTEMAES
jgi:hypothetical protein